MGIVCTKIREFKNAQELNKSVPFEFVKIHEYTNDGVYVRFVVNNALIKTDETIHNKPLNPQNKVLMYGIFFNNLLNEYKEYLTTTFKDPDLKKTINKSDTRPMISAKEYKSMPKRYRGAFIKYDSEHYILHNQGRNRLIFVKSQSNKKELESLLKQAKDLIPIIYKTDTSNIAIINMLSSLNEPLITQNEMQYFQEPAFSEKHSLSAYFVSNKQMYAIKKLGYIFNRVGDITISKDRDIVFIEDNERINLRHGARDIYNEYKNELTVKNSILNAQLRINSQKYKQEAATRLSTEYTKAHSQIISNLKRQLEI